MVIRGRTRGNGRQLGKYLLTKADNDNIQILDVDGRASFTPKHLQEALLAMSLTSELTKSDKGLYHAQINPAYGDDAAMTPEHWLKAADMLAEELGLHDQRKVIVLHTKKGRTHAHVVWERYDHQTGKMISDSFSRLAQDRARKAMERVFEMRQTPHRNVNRPEMKEALTTLWKQCRSGAEFVKRAKELGYIVAAGVQRRPFMVVDETGRSFDLVRQLEGIRTKEVREALQDQKLPAEKKAIEQVRQRQANDNDRKQATAIDFADTRNDMLQTPKEEVAKPKSKTETLAEGFADNRDEALQPETERERRMRKLKEDIDKINERRQQKGRGRSL